MHASKQASMCVYVYVPLCVCVAVLINYKGSKTIEQIASSDEQKAKGKARVKLSWHESAKCCCHSKWQDTLKDFHIFFISQRDFYVTYVCVCVST